MKYQSILKWLLPIIGVLALFASLAGVFYHTTGDPLSFTSVRGEVVTINRSGLYYYDTVSSAAQMQGNDIITIFIAVPLLAISTWLSFRKSLRGRLLLTGTLGFFLYTYMSMCMLTAYNNLFLVYVIIWAASIYAFALCLMSFDLDTLPLRFSPRLPRKLIAILLFVVGGFLSLAWLGRISASFAPGAVPGLENGITMVIQAMDLALVVPLAVVGGVLLLKKQSLGYLLAPVFIMKAITMGLAVSVMTLNMAARGVPESLAIQIPFLVITAVNLGVAVILLKNVLPEDKMNH